MPCEQLVMRLCDIKQAYTQFGGQCWRMYLHCLQTCFSHHHLHSDHCLIFLYSCLSLSVSPSLSPTPSLFPSPGKRPFGVSILYMGWDPHYGFQLYQSDPSGNYGGWKATCIGNNHQVREGGREEIMLPVASLTGCYLAAKTRIPGHALPGVCTAAGGQSAVQDFR